MNSETYILDANAILRYLLCDIPEQHNEIQNAVNSFYCITTLEVLAEVSYVLENVYGVSRSKITECFSVLGCHINIVNSEVLYRAMEVYDNSPKLDFVDCLLYGYSIARGFKIITFDKKLKARIETA